MFIFDAQTALFWGAAFLVLVAPVLWALLPSLQNVTKLARVRVDRGHANRTNNDRVPFDLDRHRID